MNPSHHRFQLSYDHHNDDDGDFSDDENHRPGGLASQLLAVEQQARVKQFLCEIFEISKTLMLNDSLKVAYQASLTILIFVEAMERGKLMFENVYPNGIADIAAQLIDSIVSKLEVPPGVRLHAVDLD